MYTRRVLAEYSCVATYSGTVKFNVCLCNDVTAFFFSFSDKALKLGSKIELTGFGIKLINPLLLSIFSTFTNNNNNI